MIEDNPSWRVYQNLLESLYARHTIRKSVAGTVESIAQITPDVLERCHRTFYHPSNMVLCVEGCVEPRKIFQMAAGLALRASSDHPSGPRRTGGSGICLSGGHLEMEVSAPSFLLVQGRTGRLPAPQTGGRTGG